MSSRFFMTLALVALSACARTPAVSGAYTHDTRELVRLDYDYNADGRIDVRTYVRHGKPVRLEGDGNGDGLIDRWEYYDNAGRLLRIGGSSQGDGREDSWAHPTGADVRIDRSTERDGFVDRREFYRGDVLMRAEADTNRDGLADTWEQYDRGAMTAMLVDEGKSSGRPTRRIVYAPDGAVARIEPVPLDSARGRPKEEADASR